MKLELGKSYRTRDGEKVAIIEDDGSAGLQFFGDNGYWYFDCGLQPDEEEKSIKSLWEDEPAATKYKAGDIVEIRLDNDAARLINGGESFYLEDELVIKHTPAPEPEFDWSTVKAGMAFKRKDNNIFWYVAADITDKDYAIFTDSEGWINFDCYFIGNFKRAPEHDIIIKEIK